MKRNTPSQTERILARLRSGGWVSSVALSGISLQYNARILELRRSGFDIASRVHRRKDGVAMGFFQLIGEPIVPSLTPQQPSQPQVPLLPIEPRWSDPGDDRGR